MMSSNGYTRPSILPCIWIIISLMVILAQTQGQNNDTDFGDYENMDTNPTPSDAPETTTTDFTFTFPSTTPPNLEVQQPTLPDITPIIEEVDQSCCAIPSLDCSMVNQQIRGASRHDVGVSFLDAHQPLDVARQSFYSSLKDDLDGMSGDFNSSRSRRQITLQDQYIDQLGINLLRFESCLCQANRSPSACRMMFPPGFYVPNNPGLFDVLFNGDLVVKRFKCSFYNGNIVDCLFQSRIPYDSLTAPMVYFVVNDKAEISGTQCMIPYDSASMVYFVVNVKAEISGKQCITCNSFYCTFESFKKRNQGSTTPFNQDYATCVADRSGTPIPTTTTTTPKPFWTGPPLSSSQHVLEDHDESAMALKDLSLITRKGILLGLGRHGGQTTLQERYDIRIDPHGGHHPILHHDHHDNHHKDRHYIWIIILAVIVLVLTIVIVMAIIVYLSRRHKGKVGVQRSLRGLPIVKMDVLDPSPFCGGGGGGNSGGSGSAAISGGGVVDNEYEYRSGVSEISRSSWSSYTLGPGSCDSLKYSVGDAAPPVARVVPFPKPARKPSKQPPLPAPPPSSRTNSSSHSGSHVEGSRFRGHSSSSSPSNRSRELTIHEDNNSDDNVFITHPRPEVRTRNIPSASTRSDASSIHIYSATVAKRPKVPPRSPGNTLNNRSDNSTAASSATLGAFNPGSHNTLTLKPQIVPRSPRHVTTRKHDNASRTSSNQSTSSGRSLIQHHHNNNNSNNPSNIKLSAHSRPHTNLEHFDTIITPIHRTISNRRSNIPSTSSSRGSKCVQGFYYDVDEEFEDYNDIYASIDENSEEEEEEEMHHDEEVLETSRKGHSRYETRIRSSEDMAEMTSPSKEGGGGGRGVDQTSPYEVPVRSALLGGRPSVPVKPARLNPPVANTMPSTIAPPVPQRTRPWSSSSSSSSGSASPAMNGDIRQGNYGDPSRLENEYTVIRDDLVQTGLKYS